MSEDERIEQGVKTLFKKLLIAESDEERSALLKPLKKEPAAEEALLILLGEIQDGQKSFHDKATEQHYYDHHEKDFDEFEAALTLTANEIPDFLAQDTNIPVTWSLLEKVHKSVGIAWLDEKERQKKKSKYKSVVGLGLFEADPQANHALDGQSPSEPTDKNIVGQNPKISLTATARRSKPLSDSELTTPAPSQSESFAALFESPDELAKCIEVLRAYRPKKPVINDSNTWMGKHRDGSKGILIAWVERLGYCEKIPNLPPKQLVPLLEEHFPGLKFGKGHRHFGNVMKADFSELIPK